MANPTPCPNMHPPEPHSRVSRTSNRSPEKYWQAFSLIEVLAGVTIIAVLGMLLFPAFSRTIERMSLSKCTHQMKLWGTAFHQYGADNDGYLPTRIGNMWQEEIAPYIVTKGTTGQLRHVLRTKWKCPNDKKTFDAWAYGTSNYLNTTAYPYAPIKFVSLGNLSRQAILVETEASGVWNTNPTTGKNGDGIFYRRHEGRANFLFADSHVETLSPEQAAEKVIIKP